MKLITAATNTLSEGITNVSTGGHLRLYPGSYSGVMTLIKDMIQHSCGGKAYLGTSKGVGSTAPPDSLSRPEERLLKDQN